MKLPQRKNIYNRNKSNTNGQQCEHYRTKYNAIRGKSKYRYNMNESMPLCNITKTQPKAFWKELKNAINLIIKSQINQNLTKC